MTRYAIEVWTDRDGCFPVRTILCSVQADTERSARRAAARYLNLTGDQHLVATPFDNLTETERHSIEIGDEPVSMWCPECGKRLPSLPRWRAIPTTCRACKKITI